MAVYTHGREKKLYVRTKGGINPPDEIWSYFRDYGETNLHSLSLSYLLGYPRSQS